MNKNIESKRIKILEKNIFKMQSSSVIADKRIIELENGIENCIAWVKGHFTDNRLSITHATALRILLVALDKLETLIKPERSNNENI